MISNVFDFNNLCVRHYFVKDVEAETDHPNIQLWRYRIIESVYNSLFKENDVNEIILAVDAKKSWRKLYWSRYKESREGKRDAAKIDWNLFHKEYESLCDDIQENLPFKEEEFHHIFSREPYSCFSISPMADGSWRCHILTEKYSYHLTKQNTFTHTKAYSKEPTDSWKTVAEINDILSKMFEEQW